MMITSALADSRPTTSCPASRPTVDPDALLPGVRALEAWPAGGLIIDSLDPVVKIQWSHLDDPGSHVAQDWPP